MAKYLVAFSLVLTFLLQDFAEAQSSPLFDCQPSSQQSGQVFLPTIPNFYFSHTTVARFRNLTQLAPGVTYVFTHTPPLPAHCTGTIVAVEYCYRLLIQLNDRNREIDIFALLSLNRSNLTFTVASRLNIRSVPNRDHCAGQGRDTCCDTTMLTSPISFPSPGSSIGVNVLNNNALPLTIPVNSEHFLLALGTNPHVGTSHTFTSNTFVNGPLPLIRFFIIPDNPITEATAATETRDTIMPTESVVPTGSAMSTGSAMPTGSSMPTGSTGFVEQPVMTPPEMMTPQSTTQNGSPKLPTILGDADPVNGALVGGVVGGICLVSIFLLLLSVIVSVLVLRRRKQQYVITRDGNIQISNALYEDIEGSNNHANTTTLEKEQKFDSAYAEVGPRGYEEVFTKGSSNLSTPGEDLYVVPARDEATLYSQLDQIRTQTLSRNSIQLGEKLGSGQFGVVYKGVWQSTKGEVEVAVKTLREGAKEEDRVKFLQEATIMGQFNHYNVVTMYGVVTDGEPILIALELLPKGDLREHLLQFRTTEGIVNTDNHTLLSYCRQVASGMAYLSSKAFVHRDLAARNVLVSDDDICKIADFGMSRDLMDESYYVSHGGKIPVKWTAPEALNYKKYSTASDVWSYGALMYEIWSVGHKPFGEVTNGEVLSMIDTGYRLPPPPGCPQALYKVMISCWHPKTSERPDFTDISRQLSLPDSKLLKWSEEDKAVHLEAAKLGADLLSAQDLYKDLQMKYKKNLQ